MQSLYYPILSLSFVTENLKKTLASNEERWSLDRLTFFAKKNCLYYKGEK